MEKKFPYEDLQEYIDIYFPGNLAIQFLAI